MKWLYYNLPILLGRRSLNHLYYYSPSKPKYPAALVCKRNWCDFHLNDLWKMTKELNIAPSSSKRPSDIKHLYEGLTFFYILLFFNRYNAKIWYLFQVRELCLTIIFAAWSREAVFYFTFKYVPLICRMRQLRWPSHQYTTQS